MSDRKVRLSSIQNVNFTVTVFDFKIIYKSAKLPPFLCFFITLREIKPFG